VAVIDRAAWDTGALRDGIGVAALGAVPFGVIGRLVLDDGRHDDLLGAFALLVLVALVLGGGVAAWRQRLGRPLSHGIATALATFAAVQLVGLVRRTAAGDEIRWGRIVSSALLSLIAGTIGGLLGSLLQRQGMRSRLP
jgi:hypothetical protein